MTTKHAKSWLLCVAALVLPVVTGCAAFRPVKGIPASCVPDEYRGGSRSGKRTIDLKLLQQQLPQYHLHRCDSGDLLSIYVEGILGRRDQPPPVNFPQQQNADTPPSVGYSVPVRDDGSISLPLVGNVPVRGLTLVEVEQRLREAYMVKKQFLQPDAERVMVFLQKPRTYRVLVIRQEASSDVSISAQGTLNIGALKRGTGKVVNLPVYKNDVLNALAETGGLPGLDAENALYIIRSRGGMPNPAWTPVTTDVKETSRTVVRAQSPGWSGPSAAVNPHGDYRRSASPGWSPPNGPVPSNNGFSGPNLAPIPDQNLSYPTPQGAWSAPQQSLQTLAPPSSWNQPGSYAPAPMTMETNRSIMPVGPARPVYPGSMPPPQFAAPVEPPTMMSPDNSFPPTMEIGDSLDGRRIIRIPIRLGPEEHVDIRPEDVILEEGDILFIESRDTEVFYTGGLLGGGQYSLPRDYDLDVLGAIAVASGQRASGGGGTPATMSVGGQSALNGDVSISASKVIVLRPLPDGTQIPIQVDLYQALQNPAERTVIQPGDYILLQYTPLEAVGAFIERHLLAGALFTLASTQSTQGK
jgi:protein involved in polysaccharide export with SLBB domain